MARDPKHFRTIVCENPVWAQEMEDLHQRLKSGTPGKDNDLCRLQEGQSSRGYIPAEIVKSIYGWTVRYASGLQGFGILHSARNGDGTLRSAVQWALDWAKEAPACRDVYIRTYNLTPDDVAVLDELAPLK